MANLKWFDPIHPLERFMKVIKIILVYGIILGKSWDDEIFLGYLWDNSWIRHEIMIVK
jgi:hypothetical protein